MYTRCTQCIINIILSVLPVLRELAVSGSDSLERLAMEHSTSSSLSLTRPLHCHALLSRGDLCLRANTILYYIEANRMVSAWLVYMCTIITSHRYRHPSTSALSTLREANLQELLEERWVIQRLHLVVHCENTRLATVEICDVNQKQVLYLRLRPLSIFILCNGLPGVI